MRDVVVTGAGILSPYGLGLESFWEGINRGTSAIASLTAPMPEGLRADITRRFGGRSCAWAMERILEQTLHSAGLRETDLTKSRGAVYFANHFDNDAYLEGTQREWRVDRWSAWLRDRTGAAEGGGVLTGCTASNMAIGLGLEAIASGDCEWALVGGMDLLHEELITEFESLRMLSTTGCRPFSADHDGTILGDGAGLLLLQSGARGLARITGYGVSSDLTGMGRLDPRGSAIREAMVDALAFAGRNPLDVDYINAGATGSAGVDDSEVNAIADLFGAASPTVYSVKPLIGHSIGGAGVVEAIATILSLRKQYLPSALIDPRVPPRGPRLDIALNNTIAMSGHVCTTLFERVTSRTFFAWVSPAPSPPVMRTPISRRARPPKGRLRCRPC